MKQKLSRPILVEGKYDKIRLENIFDTVILTTDGFGIFKDKEKAAYLRRLAEERGLIVCTDSDAAGFVIRNHLKSLLPNELVLPIYLPPIAGKEKRKAHPSKEGILGVEGTPDEVILAAFRAAGALDDAAREPTDPITRADFYEWGLIGAPESSTRRQILAKKLDLPSHLSTTALLDAVNLLSSRERLTELLEEDFLCPEIRSKN